MSITPNTLGNEPKVLELFVTYMETVAKSKKTGKSLGLGSIKTYKSNAGSFLKSYGGIELKYLMAPEYIEAALEYDNRQTIFDSTLKKSHHGINHLQDFYTYQNKKLDHETEASYYQRIYNEKKFTLEHKDFIHVKQTEKMCQNQWVSEYLSQNDLLTCKSDDETIKKKDVYFIVMKAVNFVEQQKTRAMYAQWNLKFDNIKKRKLEQVANTVAE